jgi:hypothetical protein
MGGEMGDEKADITALEDLIHVVAALAVFIHFIPYLAFRLFLDQIPLRKGTSWRIAWRSRMIHIVRGVFSSRIIAI